MSLSPLLNAPPLIVVHVIAAMAAFGLGIVQLARSKGTGSHRVFGWVWILLMAIVALSSFWIHEIRQFGPFSLIHALSLFTLATLPIAVLHARRHLGAKHRNTMISLFAGALVIAGLFTLLPGRLMHEVVFGSLR
jgi:uncharacterized membrane protein